jgi:hypothetical protein
MKKQKPETDEQLFARYQAIQADQISQGKTFDLEHELCAAIARRDNEIAERKAQRQIVWGKLIHYSVQLAIAGYVYFKWDELDLKMLVLLLAVFLWKSISYSVGKIQYLQMRTLLWLGMAHPKAKDEFFHSEHCYTLESIGRRVDDMLRKHHPC